jgi:hypothetical protein
MKKKSPLKKIVYVILIIILIVPVLVSIFGDRALKAGIETAASKTLKVDVALEDISLSILSGSVKLENLIVANPEGYENINLLEAGVVKIDLGVKSLLSDTVEIQNMIFSDITVVIEQKGFTNNLQQILDSLPKPDKDEPKEKTNDKTDAKEKTEKNLLIKNLEMNNITVKVKLIPLPGKIDTIPLTLTPIKMTNLGTDNKLSVASLSAKILTAIALGVAEKGLGVIPDEITKPIKGALGAGTKVIIKSGEGIIKGAGGIIKVGGEAGKGITDGIKGIFGKKEDKKDVEKDE